MDLQDQSMEILKQLLSLDDKTLEDGFEDFVTMFQNEAIVEESKIQKLAYCRANNLTEDDLLEENKSAVSLIEDFGNYSPIKKRLIEEIFSAGNRVNDLILKQGLYPKVNVRVERLKKEMELPQYAHEVGDSGLDVKVLEDIILDPHSTKIVPTGIKVAIPLGYEIQVRPRSGNSVNYQDLFIANSPGTIDANYRNEVGIIMRNMGENAILFLAGSKIAQLVLTPVIKLNWIEVDNINDYPSDRTGGFGSTGA